MTTTPISFLDSQTFHVEYSKEFNCGDDLKATLTKVSTYISDIWASFPVMDENSRIKLREKGVTFAFVNSIPSMEKCNAFKEALQLEIVTALSKEAGKSSVELSTDYEPEGVLYKISKAIFKEEHRSGYLGSLFPSKSHTIIILKEDKTKLALMMGFKTY